MSLEKKVSIGIFAVLSATACEEHSINLGGATISESSTDGEGKAYFTENESSEEVEVHLSIAETDIPIVDAAILYFDHPELKTFSITRSPFPPRLEIAEHNSSHFYSLTPGALPVLYDSLEK